MTATTTWTPSSSTTTATRTTATTRRTTATTVPGTDRPGVWFALGLGANLGAAEATLRHAVERLAAALGPLAIAPLYRSRPRPPLPQPPFLNTAVCGTTGLSAEAVLSIAKQLELAAGRRRQARLAPRPLDIDLLLYGDRVSDRPELTLPHPRLAERRFALAPLAAVAPDARVPPEGTSVAALLARVGQEEEVEEVGWGEN